ncbi:acyl-CoA N-acyltransferase, partial [Lentinula raphanica]
TISPDIERPLQIRPLASTDYRRGHLHVLSVLTIVTDPGEAAWVHQYHAMRSAPSTYYTVVIINRSTDMIVGVGSVFIERKFLRGLGSVGHIEDIAVDKDQQGKKLGLRIIQALTYISENYGCYKTILNCNDSNIPFYEKCGFKKKENEMVLFLLYGVAHCLNKHSFDRRNMHLNARTALFGCSIFGCSMASNATDRLKVE